MVEENKTESPESTIKITCLNAQFNKVYLVAQVEDKYDTISEVELIDEVLRNQNVTTLDKKNINVITGPTGGVEGLISTLAGVSTKNEIVYQNTAFNNIRLALESEYNFRQNEYPNTNFEVYIPETETYETVDVSTTPNAYHLLNFNSSIDLKVTHKSTLTIGLTVTNLLNTSYRNYLNRLRYYADDLGRNFVINLKINY